MLKLLIRTGLQKLLGYDNYLFVFAVFNVKRRLRAGHDAGFMHFVKMIPNRGIVLDIGANIGITTVLLATELNRSVIFAFEPVKNNLVALERVIQHYALTNVKVVKTALGDENGEREMITPILKGAKMQGLSHIVMNDNDEDGETFSVAVQKMDDIPELQGKLEIVAVKLDVENFEYYVLKGGRELLARHRPLVYCELWDREWRAQSLALMKELGYTVKIYNKGSLINFAGQEALDFFFIP